MPQLKLVVDDIAVLPEAIRPLYVERDGKFHLDLEPGGSGGGADDDGQKALKALQAEREARKSAERAAREFREKAEKFDKAEEARIAAERKAEEDKAREAGNFEKLIQQREADWQKRETEYKTRITETEAARNQEFLEHRVMASIVAAKPYQGRSEPLRYPVLQRAKVVQATDGTRTIQVLDKDGQPMLAKSGAPATLEDLLAEYRDGDVFSHLFEGSDSSGGGARRSAGGAGGRTITITQTEARDHQLWKRRNDEALKAGQTQGVVTVPG